jgi:BON domain
MLEPFFGSATPMWTTQPPSGFGLQPPIGFGTGPLGSPAFAASGLAAAPGTMPAPGQSPPGPPFVPTGAYGYSPGLIAVASQSLGAFPPVLAELTAPALLAAIAVRRGQPLGPTTDPEIEDFIYDALDLLPGAADVEVRCEGGRATLTGSVQHKRVKHDAGELVWAIPVVHDVQNNLTIAPRRRPRAAREGEGAAHVPSRKQN